MPASQMSTLRLRDPEKGVDEERVITFNEPLDHRGFTIYQNSHALVGKDAKGQPVHRSLLTVTRRPGAVSEVCGQCDGGDRDCVHVLHGAYSFKRAG